MPHFLCICAGLPYLCLERPIPQGPDAMSTDGDLIKLYSGQILALAADIPKLDRLASPDITVKKRSPLCGSTVTVDV
jgi:hypothetical protein